MTTIQRKAIRQAIKLLEEMQSRVLWPENHKDEASLKAAAKRHSDEVYADGGKKMEAVEWLKAALESEA